MYFRTQIQLYIIAWHLRNIRFILSKHGQSVSSCYSWCYSMYSDTLCPITIHRQQTRRKFPTRRKIPMSRVIRTNCFTATGTVPFIPWFRFVPYHFPTCSHNWFILITISPLTTDLPHGRYIPCSVRSLFSTQPYSFTGRKHNIIYYKTAVSYIVILRSHIL